jgi:hypothetical protein
VIVTARAADVAEVERRARDKGVPARTLGTTGGARLVIRRDGAPVADVALDALRAAREECLEGIVGA